MGVVIESSQLLGKTLGTCAIQRLIGRGGMGAVYLAQQARPRREVAVKVFMPALLLETQQRSEFLARFRREADAIAALDHINIVPLYEYGEQNELAYLVMPYVTGGTLRDLLEKRGILPLTDVVPIIEQAAAALDYAHEQGIIHRDLKPGNILFHADGRVLLADFGLAKILKEATESTAETTPEIPSGITGIGTIIGTPEYFSPEQSTGNLVDRRTDVYSLGIVLYQMLSGHVPFTGATPVAIAVKHTTEEPPSLLQYNSTVPYSVEAVIMKAIAKKPDQRFNSAGELAHALRSAVPDALPSQSQSLYAHPQDITHQMTPIVLTNNDTVADMPEVNANEALTVQTPPTLSAPQTPEPQQIPQPTFNKQAMPAMLPIAAQPRLKKRDGSQSKWLLLMATMLALVLLIGGSINYLHFGAGYGAAPTSRTGETPPSPAATAAANPQLPVGTLLYSAMRPDCDAQSNLWSKTTNARTICNQSALELQNTTTSHLAGVFLDTLPNGSPIPTDYVLHVQISRSANSYGPYGVFFRNQPGSQQGTYSFMLDPSGYWKAYTYDNVTGAASSLYGQKATVQLHGFTTIDIVVHGNTFMFYLNGVYQGKAESPTYTTGTLGFAVDTGADVYIKNLAIYNLPTN